MTSPQYPLDAAHAPDLGGEPVLDADTFGALAELAGDDDPDLVAELVELFREDSRARIASIVGGMSDGDVEAVGAAAHALKSSGANIGALAFSRACAELEGAARSRGGVDAARLEALVQRTTRLHAEVLAVLAEPSACDLP